LVHFGARALRHHAAAMHARAGAHVDHVVGARIMSSSCSTTSTRVAKVAQVLAACDEAVVVALVQADAGLVEHVHHAREARANLGRQPDALGLTAESVSALRSRLR
jgi:CMP-2-keto-3-deoxyoctulosonic acid synthetase